MKKENRTRRLIHCASLGVSLMIGWLLCESVLRVLVPGPIFYSTWFTEGVHQRDPYFGFVFRPDYDGTMRNVDQVWSEPLQLDSGGFRKSAVREGEASDGQQPPAPPKRIAMLGSASMGFGYGLADHETLHHQVADHLAGGCQIDLISWPGFTLGQDVQKLARMLEPDQYDIGVILAYGKDDYAFHPDWDTIVTPENLQMMDSVVTPDDPASRLGGEFYWNSYVWAGVCRLMQVPFNLLRANPSDGNSGKSSSLNSQLGKAQVAMAAERLRSLGIDAVLIVALPRQSDVAGPADLSEVIDSAWVDLRYEPEEQNFDWIAYGHYGPRSASHLAGKITAAIKSLE